MDLFGREFAVAVAAASAVCVVSVGLAFAASFPDAVYATLSGDFGTTPSPVMVDCYTYKYNLSARYFVADPPYPI